MEKHVTCVTFAVSLKVHMQTHREPTYECNICQFKCRMLKVLGVHVKIYSDAKPFRCDYCGYRAKRKADLKTQVHAMCTGRLRRKLAEETVALFFDSLAGSYLRESQIPFEPGIKKKFARIAFVLQKQWGWLV